MPFASFALASDHASPFDLTFTRTATYTNTTTLTSSKVVMITFMRTSTLHNLSRGLGVTIVGSAGIGSTMSITTYTNQPSDGSPALFGALLLCVLGLVLVMLRKLRRSQKDHRLKILVSMVRPVESDPSVRA
jgi:uncharacterized membrane protein YfcA